MTTEEKRRENAVFPECDLFILPQGVPLEKVRGDVPFTYFFETGLSVFPPCWTAAGAGEYGRQ